MDRLFVFGDSWAFNYFSNDTPKYRPDIESYKFLGHSYVEKFVEKFNYFGHWTDYLSNIFEVQNYSEPGCSNEDIIHQLSYLPNYEIGDRIIIIFSNCARYQWFDYKKERHAITYGSSLQSQYNDTIKNFLEEQLVIRDTCWIDGYQRQNEKMFYKKISTIYKEYEPIKLSWDDLMCNDDTSIKLIPFESKNFTTINFETNGRIGDGHLGFNGNYKLYTWICELLQINKTHIQDISFNKKLL